MVRIIGILILFIIFTLIKLAFRATKKAVEAGKVAYDSITNSSSFEEAYKNFARSIGNKERDSAQRATNNQMAMLEEVIALMAKVAASDGRISREEVEYMSETIVTIGDSMLAAGVHSSIVEQVKKSLFSVANSAKSDDKPIYYYTAVLSNAEIELRKRAMLQIIGFAGIDGYSEAKMELLFRIGVSLHFTKDELVAFIQQVFGRPEEQAEQFSDPYKVLGCQETDSFDTVRLAYRRLVKKYHPDYLHGQGADDATVQEATRKIQEINAAYEQIKARRG